MEQCKNLYYFVEKLIKVGHLKQYVCILDGQDEVETTEWAPPSLAVPRAVINYIHGGPVDDKYHQSISKWGILTNFNGASTVSLGNVVLLVQAGLVILNVYFSVVEDLSPYNAFMGWVMSVSSLLTKDERTHLEGMLPRNANIFTWTHSNMLGIDPSMVAHKLNILPHARPVR
ncbi:hypothetical protein CK203_014325 [Vitis vinifera]|uniref:Uncharacterized protein n=1 Tax=Vitis vinifera TaxID=29760 RepID=A0A438K515_VITVI|nr:hypothetical protein CK203_014325 [Vitis vinifera]